MAEPESPVRLRRCLGLECDRMFLSQGPGFRHCPSCLERLERISYTRTMRPIRSDTRKTPTKAPDDY